MHRRRCAHRPADRPQRLASLRSRLRRAGEDHHLAGEAMKGGQAISPALALLLVACATGSSPIVEREARGTTQSPYFVVFITGDGGWRKIDVKVSDVLRDAGMPVVGLLANHYFARER